ncbi:unnamed protein product [Closterium sp. NIES-54]
MNSFAVQLTAAEARRLKRHPAVAEVERDRTVRVTSVHSPEFLKLDSSLWPANGGQSNAGEGVIIGVIDTGIWPEHPSFSNPVSPNVQSRWRGVCTKTKDFTACNSKVVGARYFLKGMEREYGRVGSRLDYRSPRDMEQHGTWCAGAAAGNAGVDVTIGGRNFGAASGMAPRARLAIYKGLWIADGYHGVGVMSDLIAAANKAVADGVDVISCSWGGMALYIKDIPYLQGLKAGVVTAFAAGNEGRPNPWSMWGTLSNVSPFYLTVGASHTFCFHHILSPSFSFPLPFPLISLLPFTSQQHSNALRFHYLLFGKFASTPLFPLLSSLSPLPPSIFPLPPSPFSLPPSIFPLPSPSCQCSPIATLSTFTVSYSSNAPQLTYFSSTGPPRSPFYPPALLIRDFPTNDILKPDVIGPGDQLWAAGSGESVDTAATDAPNFNYWSGTSMSTPQLAGIMALMVQNKPSWSPSQVISAITTTAYTRNKNGQPIQRANGKKATAWDYGGGHVDPTRVLDPGLTFHAAHKHFVNFLMMRDPIRTKKRFWRMGKALSILPWNLNRASIAVTRLHGITVVYRQVKNVYNLQSTYRAKVVPPPGFIVRVLPKKMTIRPGKSRVFRVAMIRFLPLPAFRFGKITWSDQHGHSVAVRLVWDERACPRPLGPLTATAAPAYCSTMTSLRVLAFDHDGTVRRSSHSLLIPCHCCSRSRASAYLFPELSAFAIVEDLVSHLCASDARYRAAVPAEFLDKNQPPMFITLYFIVTRLPDSLRSVRDHFLSLDPTYLTV